MLRQLLIAWSTVILNAAIAVAIARRAANQAYERGVTHGREQERLSIQAEQMTKEPPEP